MSRRPLSIVAGTAVLALAACSDTNTPAVLADSDITADVATTAGDAIATDISHMLGSEAFAGMPGAGPVASPPGRPPLDVTRSRTCYDSAGTVQSACDRLTTASVLIQISARGQIAFTDSVRGVTVTGSTARARKDSISGLLGTETSRTHNGSGSGLDSLTITGTRGTRSSVESSSDTVVGLVFNLPRSTNPWPTRGQIIRNVRGTVTFSGGGREGTRTYSRRVVVTFPADAQGNVPITINDKRCTLNLVTRRVVCS